MQFLADLFRYTTWADNTLLSAALKLDPAELDIVRPSPSLNTIRANLNHMMGAQWIWLSRFNGVSPTAFPNPAETPTLDSLKARWDAVHADLEAYATGLDEATFSGMLTFRNTEGREYTDQLYLCVMHCFNHGMDHRVTCSAFCALAGSDPGDLNILTYIRRKPPTA